MFYGAPTVILVLAKMRQSEDGSLAIGNMQTPLTFGPWRLLIHCIRETFQHELGKQLLKECGYEGDYIGVGSCILGYPANGFPPPIPKNLLQDNQIITIITFCNSKNKRAPELK